MKKISLIPIKLDEILLIVWIFLFFLENNKINSLLFYCRYDVGRGFHVIAAHTDSPCLKLKPISATSKSGYLLVNVQTYGAGLWHTWFDRDLSVAGRVILRTPDGSFMHKLVKVKRPLLRVPTLAIHLDRWHNLLSKCFLFLHFYRIILKYSFL